MTNTWTTHTNSIQLRSETLSQLVRVRGRIGVGVYNQACFNQSFKARSSRMPGSIPKNKPMRPVKTPPSP